MDRKRLGNKGELLACGFIRNKGLQIVERNFKCRAGEIDIIAKDDNYIVIIEVRSATDCSFHDPLDSFTPLKIRRLKRLALIWLDYHNKQDAFIRFDIITVVFNVRNNINIKYIKDAF
jgi:putative endonuclease